MRSNQMALLDAARSIRGLASIRQRMERKQRLPASTLSESAILFAAAEGIEDQISIMLASEHKRPSLIAYCTVCALIVACAVLIGAGVI